MTISRSTRQPFAPYSLSLLAKIVEALVVAADTEVSKVPLQLLTQLPMLVNQRLCPNTPTLLVYGPECSRKSILCRLLPDNSVALPRLAPDMQEAEEAKRRGHRGLAVGHGCLLDWTEVNHLGLVRV